MKGSVLKSMDQRHGRNDWRRARRCSSAACVEVAITSDSSLVRDSKVSEGPILTFGRPQWRDFISGIQSGDFRSS
jgi:hypothetical protein